MYFVKSAGVLIFLTLVLSISYTLGKRHYIHLEVQRKLLHMGLGLVALFFPLLFHTTLEVAFLLIVALAVLLLLRYIPFLRRTLGESIYGVKRSWLGGGLFLISIVALFFFSHGNYTLYVRSLLPITFADAFAAIIGTKYGKTYYRIFGSNKSIQGSLTFFVSGFTSVHLLLVFTKTTPPPLTSIFISLAVASLSMVTELFSGRDFDNLTIPTVTFVVLHCLL